MKENYKRLGGWLLYYTIVEIIGLAFKASDISYIINNPVNSSIINDIQLYGTIIILIISAYRIYLILRKKVPSSIGKIQVIIIIEGVINIIMYVSLILYDSQFPNNIDYWNIIYKLFNLQLLNEIANIVIGYSYSVRSERVKVYFGNTSNIES